MQRGVGRRLLPTINGNLLIALDALLRARSVSQAAFTMGVTQSTMSGTLAQLRELFSDPLLVRHGRSMVPTSVANAIAADLRRGVDALETVLSTRGAFDPATSREEFVIALNDRSEEALLPRLVATLRTAAPGTSLQVLPWGLFEPPPGLADGTIDLVIGIDGTAPAGESLLRTAGRGLCSSALFESGLTTIARTDHPHVGRRLTLDRFCELEHILATEEPHGTGVVDEVLATMGRQRRIAVRVHRHALVAKSVASTDLVATIGRRTAAVAAKQYALRRFKPPVALPTASFTMIWHASTEEDPARQWLRAQVRRTSRGHRG